MVGLCVPKILRIFPIVLLFTLSSCTGERILFITDTYFYFTSVSGQIGESGIKKIGASQHKKIDFFMLDPTAEIAKQLASLPGAKTPERILLSPLASVYLDDLRRVFPEIPVFSMAPQDGSGKNRTAIISYDRTDAFREAGRLAGDLVKRAGAEDPAGEKTGADLQATAIFYTGTEKRVLEKSAFLETFLPSVPRESWYEYTFDSLDSFSVLDSVVSEISVKNPAVLIIFASSFNSDLFVRLSAETRTILVTEDGLLFGIQAPGTIISVEEPLSDALNSMLGADIEALPGQLSIKAKTIIINKGKMFDKEL